MPLSGEHVQPGIREGHHSLWGPQTVAFQVGPCPDSLPAVLHPSHNAHGGCSSALL